MQPSIFFLRFCFQYPLINYPAQDGEKSNLTCPMSKSNGAAPTDTVAKEVLANGKAKSD